MKKHLYLLPVLLLSGNLMAMGPEEGPGGGGPPMGGMHEGREQEGLANMKEKLGLSEDQAKKLKALQESQGKDMKTLQRKMRDLMAKLEDQVDDKATDSALDATLKELKVAQKEMMAAHEKLQEAREAILTPTQRAKGLLMMRGGHGGGKVDEGEHEHEQGKK